MGSPTRERSCVVAKDPALVLADEAQPVLLASVALLRILSLYEARGCISDEGMSALLLLMADRLDYARGLIDRWQSHEELSH